MQFPFCNKTLEFLEKKKKKQLIEEQNSIEE